MNYLTIIINSVSLLLIAFLCLTIKPRIKKLSDSFGECLFPLTRRKNWLSIIVIVAACGMIILQFFREFQFYIMIIMDAVAVLGTEICIKDFIVLKIAGVYEKALVTDGRIIYRDDIIAFPTLEYENTEEYLKEKMEDEYSEDALETAQRTLKIVTNSSGEIYTYFASKEERAKVVELLTK